MRTKCRCQPHLNALAQPRSRNLVIHPWKHAIQTSTGQTCVYSSKTHP